VTVDKVDNFEYVTKLGAKNNLRQQFWESNQKIMDLRTQGPVFYFSATDVYLGISRKIK
jgi:CRISPR/Cas system type I-B associated protein Csh2 (Cas7 group RAMP superfamily)